MKFERLRLAGFKSFCDPSDFKIEPGLTGVVGPNGCGKSNLVEAMRWVMGENSYKNMRASGMDDVIFSGSGRRPSRNFAEVSLVLDNSERRAPAAFNDSETIEVARRIEREHGSTYRVNGREVRARDVQLLFADASTGARSPAMVRQGQIGEIIAAKPQARRLILEEAAGVSGLHSRRHEAELRLKGADDNLRRLEDVLKQVDSQVESLKRQARQSQRYRALAADIRRHDALAALISWRALDAAFREAEVKLETDVREVGERTRRQAESAVLQAHAAADLPNLRNDEARVGAILQRLISARDALERDEKRARERVAELERSAAQLHRDRAREEALVADAEETARLLTSDLAQHEALDEGADDARAAVRSELASAEATLRVAETQLAAAQSAHSDVAARRGALTLSLGEETRRVDRLGAELANVERERDALRAADIGDAERRTVVETAERTHEIHENSQDEVHAAEEAHIAARDVETRLRGPLAESEAEARGLEAEARTLQKLLGSPGEGGYAPIVDSLQVARGYETALGAALGDDLDASADESAPAHWSRLPGDGADPALPEGVEPLARSVEAPPALQRRLAQIGIVSRAAGGDLAAKLRPGQRLVSLEGDFWRWDGFVAAAEAPTPAARRLAERNRFGDLARRAEAARQNAEALRLEAHAAQATTQVAAQRETSAKQRLRIAAIERDAARERVAGVEKRRVQVVSRLAALDEAADRARGSHEEAIERRSTAEAALVELSADSESAAVLTEARGEATEARTAFTEAKSNAQTLEREIESRIARRAGLTRDLRSWEERAEGARARIQEFDARGETAMQEREQLLEAPAEFDRQRRGLMREIEAAEAARKIAADARALGDVALAEADRIARAALEVMSAARESRAASEQRLAAAAQRRAQTLQQIADELETEPHGLPEIAGLKSGETPPEIDYVQRKRDSLKQERERLGAVNLRAEDELTDIETSRDKMVSERDDLTEAIKRLRAAIQSLNQEGRERLVAAFDVVNGHFKQLFATLFEGGEAELQLVESEDPLHAGLELLARPPGKKPQTLTLLSGGEQALTAMALIFAVFLTNPSPICVLDEVDAPLDDYNVERFCDLLDEMCKRSDTRFVAITHNPVTMARMDRLFGVTMAERGVSQIVSVDLATAERFLEAS